ncbi:MAG: hypothetical protein HZC36_16475 [Armatimonadetes bacterium]|nr:hypothetical protein [Armatimonadota bacterium]
MRPGATLLLVAVLWVATGLQFALAYRLSVFGVQPDFMVVAIAAAGPHLTRPGATWFGFFAGLCQGAVAGANLTHYVISRTSAGFLVGSLRELRLETGWALAAMTGFVATLFAQVVLMFLAPPANILGFLGATIGSAVTNGVLVVPLSLLLGRWLPELRR